MYELLHGSSDDESADGNKNVAADLEPEPTVP